MTRILLIRHGETVASKNGEFTGRRDVPLTSHGRMQAEEWRGVLALKEAEGAVIASSPLSRCMQTAHEAGVEPEPWPDLVEWDMGTLDGVNAAEHRRANLHWNLFEDGSSAFGGESVQQVRSRAEAVLLRAAQKDRDVILFTHGQFAKLLVAVAIAASTATASRLSLGPARGAMLLERDYGLSLAGWNLSPQAGRLWQELT